MTSRNNTENVVIFVTVPNEEEAVGIARALVEGRLAACVNIVKSIRSIYSWQGNIEDDQEVLLIAKTQSSLFEEISKKVKELHSYDVPEVIALPILYGSDDYLTWLRESTDLK